MSSTTSASAASSTSAACCLARSATSLLVFWTAAPPCCNEREPIVPPPTGTRSVSFWTTVIDAIGMPSSLAAIIAHAVWWPWPCDEVPLYTVAVPSSLITTRAASPNGGTPPVIST